MLIEEHNIPIPFLTIENLFEDAELFAIFRELDAINTLNALKTPEETGTARDADGLPLKRNSGLFVDPFYGQNRSNSPILTHGRKLFKDERIRSAILGHSSWFFRDLFYATNKDETLITYYEDQDYYKPHRDLGEFTILIWLFKEPKVFDGGIFSFTDYNYSVPLKSNKALIFPSRCLHEVSPISMPTNKLGLGLGRYTITIFANTVYLQPPNI